MRIHSLVKFIFAEIVVVQNFFFCHRDYHMSVLGNAAGNVALGGKVDAVHNLFAEFSSAAEKVGAVFAA